MAARVTKKLLFFFFRFFLKKMFFPPGVLFYNTHVFLNNLLFNPISPFSEMFLVPTTALQHGGISLQEKAREYSIFEFLLMNLLKRFFFLTIILFFFLSVYCYRPCGV